LIVGVTGISQKEPINGHVSIDLFTTKQTMAKKKAR